MNNFQEYVYESPVVRKKILLMDGPGGTLPIGKKLVGQSGIGEVSIGHFLEGLSPQEWPLRTRGRKPGAGPGIYFQSDLVNHIIAILAGPTLKN